MALDPREGLLLIHALAEKRPGDDKQCNHFHNVSII
jgi:hypothetical protein